MGAGVPCPVQPKSQMQRIATAKPKTHGMTATQRQRSAPSASTRKPSHGGSNQNQSARKAVPTASEASAVGQCEPRFVSFKAPGCPFVMTCSVIAKAREVTSIYAIEGRYVTGSKKNNT